VKITDLNSHGGIGANSLLVEMGPFRFVVDAGLHPKLAGNEAMPSFDLVPVDSLDFIILTHCHLDHLGSLPVLSREQPDAPVFLSQPSQALAKRMMMNSINVMKRQRGELNLPEYPLYTRNDVKRLAERFRPIGFRKPYHFEKDGENLEIAFQPAGHVAGAICCRLTRDAGESVFFSGDLLFTEQRTLKGAAPEPEGVDVLVLETTRGASPRKEGVTRELEVERLLDEIRKPIDKGGSCLIPVFALGRMQEMLVILDQARKDGRIPRCPVFCSGLGMSIVDYYHEISQSCTQLNFNRKVLRSLGVLPLPDHMEPGRPPGINGIFLVSSGMVVDHTPSYRVAASLLGDDRNSILFVGYCDPDTPGGKLLEKRNGEEFLFEAIDYVTQVKARIRQFDMSGHADRDELLELAHRASPRTIVLHHGDPEARQWFSEQLAQASYQPEVIDPIPGKTYEM
jgi:Cft2 family RNA processing exonuclease|tara:strand:- start:1307 stop:2668 length:1362 start_codon:yes stop_codon:yes gene_type:complete